MAEAYQEHQKLAEKLDRMEGLEKELPERAWKETLDELRDRLLRGKIFNPQQRCAQRPVTQRLIKLLIRRHHLTS